VLAYRAGPARRSHTDDVNAVAEHIEEITAEWLSAALGREIRTVTPEQIGSGQTGASYRLSLDADDTPTSAVAKLAAGDQAARRRVAQGYRAEVGFYTQLAATLDVRAPRCWYGAIADDALCFTLVLDDLAPLMPGVQVDGCPLTRAGDAVRNLAALHASRWNDDSLFDLDFFTRPTDRGATYLGEILVPATEAFVARYAAELDSSEVATLRTVARSITDWQLARREPFAVVHGDYRLDNLMFPTEGDGVVALDWQTVTVAPPTRDLAYFLGTSLHTEDRRVAEHELVASYHRELVARGVAGYDGARCFDDYRAGQLQGPFITVMGSTYATAVRTEQADRMFLAMIRRSCAAIRDLDSIGAISG